MTRTFTRREWVHKGWPLTILHTHTVEIPEVLGIEQDLTLKQEHTARAVGARSSRPNVCSNSKELHSCEVGRRRDLRDAPPAVSSFKSVDVRCDSLMYLVDSHDG